jgi:hypothetical protein
MSNSWMDKNVCSLNRRLTLVEEGNKKLKKENRWLKTKLLLQDEMIQRVYNYLPIGEEIYEDALSEQQNESSEENFEDGNGDNVNGASISEEENHIGLRAALNG